MADSASNEFSLKQPDALDSQMTLLCMPPEGGVITYTTPEEWQKAARWQFQEPLQPFHRPEVAKSIERKVDELDTELRELSIKIHDHPELGYKEKYAHDTLTEFMISKGWEVTKHYGGLETAWRASFQVGEGGRTLGFNSEMDALPGIGHACGHNLIAIVGVGGAIAVAAALKEHNIPGKVVLLGTPAEEGGQGKLKLIDAGGYKEMDACLMAHPGPGAAHSTGTGSSLAVQALEVQYLGLTAHAAAGPWEGKNSLDAAFVTYAAVSALRQQIKPTHRVHGIVQGRDWAANIIPDYAKMRWLVRAPTWAETQVLRERVKKCFQAGALATDCKMEYSEQPGTFDLRQNLTLSDEFTEVCRHYGISVDPERPGAIGGSTDFGNVTYEVPSLHPNFAIPTEPNGGNHTAAFARAAGTPEAHQVTLGIIKILAITGARILTDEGFAAKARPKPTCSSMAQ